MDNAQNNEIISIQDGGSEKQTKQAVRKEYSIPSLINHGTIEELTASTQGTRGDTLGTKTA
jgi:hypothetical protein